MKKTIYSIFLVLVIGFIDMGSLMAQVTIIPLFQNSEFLVFDNLFQVNLINTTNTPINGYLEITVEDRNNQQSVVQVNSPLISLLPGRITTSNEINWNSSIHLGRSQLVSSLSNTGRFSKGDYIFCYNFIAANAAQFLGVHCQEGPIRIAGLPRLMSPYDGESLVVNRPILTWIPPLPSFSSNIQYSLILTQRNEGQAAIEALNKNFPLVQTKQLTETVLAYPIGAKPLEEGQHYVWQVSAYIGGHEIGTTDIWEFEYVLPKEEKKTFEPESYRYVKTRLDGSYYIANEILYIAYKNRHGDGELDYEISSESNPTQVFEELPTIQLQEGLNQIELDGNLISGLKYDERYVLVIKNSRKEKFYFNFLYLEQ